MSAVAAAEFSTFPAPPGAPRPSAIAELIRRERPGLEASGLLNTIELDALRSIESCRTVERGLAVVDCPGCGVRHEVPLSCKDRHCPLCQSLDQEHWIAARSQKLFASPHYHVVLTLPAELRPLARLHPREVFNALFRASSRVIKAFGLRHGLTLGTTSVLHTWSRELVLHPHIHAIVTKGGLTEDGRWEPLTRRALFPREKLADAFRDAMLDELMKLRHLVSDDVVDPCPEALLGLPTTPSKLRLSGPVPDERFKLWLASLRKHTWMVHAEKSLSRPGKILTYLGRYTKRVAISESSIVKVTPYRVVFRTRHGKTLTVTPRDFVRRFAMHILPKGFIKVRHYGLYSGAHANDKHPVAREALAKLTGVPPAPVVALPTDAAGWMLFLFQKDITVCPYCGARLLPMSRSPPRKDLAA